MREYRRVAGTRRTLASSADGIEERAPFARDLVLRETFPDEAGRQTDFWTTYGQRRVQPLRRSITPFRHFKSILWIFLINLCAYPWIPSYFREVFHFQILSLFLSYNTFLFFCREYATNLSNSDSTCRTIQPDTITYKSRRRTGRNWLLNSSPVPHNDC